MTEQRLDYSWDMNKIISKLKEIESSSDLRRQIKVFLLNIVKYLTALKLVSEKDGYTDYEFENFRNSITRTFFCELQFHLTSVIEDSLGLDPKEYDTFNKLLKYIDEHKSDLNKTPLDSRLVENINLFYDIKTLRNIGQHFTSKKIKKTEIKDRELVSYIHMELDGSDLRINPQIFKYLASRIQEIFKND